MYLYFKVMYFLKSKMIRILPKLESYFSNLENDPSQS